jgi:hypothetical protein
MRRILTVILVLAFLAVAAAENTNISDIVRELVDETEKCMKPLPATLLRRVMGEMKVGVQNSMRRARGGPKKDAEKSCKKVVKKIKTEIEKQKPGVKKLQDAKKCFDTLFLSECVSEVKGYYK